MATYDFAGWVTKNDLLCSDGRTIRRDAFKDCDGITVPLVYHHDHSDPTNVLGHVLLENRPEGVYGYGSFNDTEKAKHSKEAVKHGDLKYLSIYANRLKQNAGNVLHGMIREVSLVMTGANPGAKIETAFGHAEEFDEEAIITTGEELVMSMEEKLAHAEEADETNDKQDTGSEGNETLEDIVNTMTPKQKNALYALIGLALEGKADDEAEHYDDDEGEDVMKYNAFENQGTAEQRRNTISHDDFKTIMADAKRIGSLKDAVIAHMEDEGGVLAHLDSSYMEGMTGPSASTAGQTYGFRDPDMLFPEYKTVNGPTPEWIKRDTGWVGKVMSKVGHTPFSRIKSVFADITEDEARAKGYIKGNLKKDEVFTLLKRTTDPQTIYKRQKMDRDDITDITDFDTVRWIKGEMRLMLDEEIARSVLIGDGRLSSSDDHISEDHIRPVVNDKPLFTIKKDVNVENGATPSDIAEAFIDAAVRSRKDYKGSGNPDLYCTEDLLTEMLLLKDGIGHRIYKTEAELATALRVNSIITVEAMENFTLDSKPVAGIVVNLADYRIGADRGGAIELFDDFDIDYNQQKYLIETRISGALVKPFSAIVLSVNEAA